MTKATDSRNNLFWAYGSRGLGSIMVGTADSRHGSWSWKLRAHMLSHKQETDITRDKNST